MKTNALNKSNKKSIPIFFATDDNYVPFLDVAIRSLIENASKDYFYDIHILNTGLLFRNRQTLKQNECENVSISFDDISRHISEIEKKFKNVYHYGLAAYYRLFIESLFPQYSKILYLDCDIVVLGDVSKLYNTDLEGNMLAGVRDSFVACTPEFQEYVRVGLGIEPENYISSGILIVDLDKFRESKIEEKFTYLLEKYNFESVAPDQDYLNFLCKGRIKYIPNGWNKSSAVSKVEGGLNIVHYALAKKPWQFDGVVDEEYFWHYAEKSPFYMQILTIKKSFTDEQKAKKELAGIEILSKALSIAISDSTFYKKLVVGGCC